MDGVSQIDEAGLERLVHAFYARVREDAELGPVFNDAIADWPEHLDKLTAFWSSVMLTTGRYKGQPVPAHRIVGYFEEEAVISYTLYLEEIDEGRSPNVPAPAIARHYWKLADDATLRDVVLAVRADEAHHRDVNHGFADELAGVAEPKQAAPYPEHAGDVRVAA